MESEAPSDENSLRSEYTFVAPDTDTLFFRPPTLEDLDAIFSLEAASYPADEAATYEKLKVREIYYNVHPNQRHCHWHACTGR